MDNASKLVDFDQFRKQLIDAINIAVDARTGETLAARIADHLIENGVTIPVRCKDCKFCERDHTLDGGGDEYYYCWHDEMEHGQARPNDFCSYGERIEAK
jgi:hypothetical protein